ncbi:MAG: UDP-glucose 4-epimerase GalE, partial [Alphaproteobacteria bacterium]
MTRAPTVLVTGGAGYIGSHACKALARAGFAPVTYDNLARGHADLVKWGPLEIGDVRDRVRLDDILRRHRPIAALHFAAYALVGESIREPMLYRDNNVRGTQSLLDALAAARISPLVFSSSCAVYGTPARVPIDESFPTAPINPYGETKLECERLIAAHETAHGARAVVLRYFNAAGADPDGDTAERHDPEPHVVPRAVLAALGRLDAFEIFGADYETPDGTAIRDYIHVTDLADAHVLALRHLLDG